MRALLNKTLLNKTTRRPTGARLVRARSAGLVALLLALGLSGCDGGRAATPASAPGAFTDGHGEVVIDLKDGSSLADLAARHPSLVGLRWNSDNVADEAIAVASVPLDRQADVLAALRADPLVVTAEHNGLFLVEPSDVEDYVLTLGTSDLVPEDRDPKPTDQYPNDPLYAKQWNMELVHARDAWRYANGRGVIVAVIDTGVAHEDEKGLWAPDLGDTDFVQGWDFVNDDPIAADDHGHGTHCAGTIAQSTDNGRGVIGLAYGARIMPLKVLSAQGWGTASDIADAIRFAADHGAHVLSLSLGGGGYSSVMASAVEHARDRGCLVVCAAGNGGRARVEYPAAYPGATAVSSVGKSGNLAYYSSHGRETFIAAPGGDKREGVEAGVLQNTLDPRQKDRTVYAWWQGTSMATPHVAGAGGLLYSCGVTDPDAIEDILRETAATPPGTTAGERTERFGWGTLDAGAAVRRALFLPGVVSLVFAAALLLVTVRFTTARDASRGLLVLGALAGSAGLFFLRPLGLGEVPLIGGFVTRGLADWDLPLLGAAWHWSPLFASALIPGLLGLASVRVRPLRSLALGLILGWTARLLCGVALPWADVRWIPGHGVLDALWLGTNAGMLLAWAAVVVRLGRGKDGGPVSL